MSTDTVTRPDRRSMTRSRSHGIGDAQGAGKAPVGHQGLGLGGEPERRVCCLFAGDVDLDVGTKLPTEAQGGEAEKLFPSGDDLSETLVIRPERARSDGLANRHPSSTHVNEVEGTGLGMLEVANELSEDPGLVRISDPAMDSLLDCDGEYLRPGHVVQSDATELAPIYVEGMNARGGSDLVGHREDHVEPVLTCDVEVCLNLRSLQFGAAGLHLDQGRPGSAGTTCLQNTVWVDGPFSGLERRLDVGLQLTGRGAKRLDHRQAELSHRAHDSQQR